MALGRGRLASPKLGRLYPRHPFYRRLCGPQEQSEHEGVKKNLHLSGILDRTRAMQPVAKRLADKERLKTENQNNKRYGHTAHTFLRLMSSALIEERFNSISSGFQTTDNNTASPADLIT